MNAEEHALRGTAAPAPVRTLQPAAGQTLDQRQAATNAVRATPGSILLIALSIGLAVGMLEGGAKTLLRGVPGFVYLNSTEILWIAPPFNALLFLGLGLVLALTSRVLGRALPVRAASGIFVCVGILDLLLVLGKLNRPAALLLSAGIAVQVMRQLRGRETRFLGWLRRTVPALVAGWIVVGIIGASWAGWREHELVSDLAPAAPNAPNVLIIVLDTLRADHVSAYGYERQTTPNIDRLARSGVLFEHAIANASWTLPSHASLLTGRLPHEHRADWLQPLPATYPTLAEALAARGYVTAAFAANTVYVTPEWGLGRGFSRFQVYGGTLADDAMRTEYGRRLALSIFPRVGYFDVPGRKRATDVNDEFLQWIDSIPDRPFFALLNYFDVHDPYLTDAEYQVRFAPEVARGDLVNFQFQPEAFRRKPTLSPREIQMEIDAYDGCLAYLDAAVGRVLAELARRGLDRRTLIVFTSDHGESFGNHDLFGHGNSLYFETLHVPLVFSWPGKIPSGVRVESLASLHQLPATVMQLLGGGRGPLPGRSLAAQWTSDTGPTPANDAVISEVSSGRFAAGPFQYPTAAGNLSSLITDEWHLIQSESGRAELYAWRDDPDETRNLAETPAGRAAIAPLQRRLAEP